MFRIALLVVAIGGLALLAAPIDPAWRLAGALSLLVSAVLLAAVGLPVRADHHPKARVWYTGSYPPVPSGSWATAWVKPEGLVLDFGRRGKIGKALREVDPAVQMVEPGHLADHRFGELRRLFRAGQLRHADRAQGVVDAEPYSRR